MVCPCLAVPLLIGGAVGSAHQLDMIVFSLLMSLIVVVALILKAETRAPCSACNAFSDQ